MNASKTESQKDPDSLSVLPGATIGMVGGGQLGRMFAIAAVQMGYQVVVLCESENDPAAQVAHQCVVGSLSDPERVKCFASQCDVITLEFENIPSDTIAGCQEYASTYPSAEVLKVSQHRLLEKQTLSQHGLPVATFAQVSDAASLKDAGETTGWPLILKTAVSGYDGKGQHRLESIEQADQVDWDACHLWVAERIIPFDLEISVIVARAPDGRTATFPVFENRHRNHILDVTLVPGNVSSEVAERARSVAIEAAMALEVVGLLCVEMFVCGDQVIVNEVAPRPHNSGHVTIEACHTSQFQQHVRAICNLPLGSTDLVCGGAAMANLLGDVWHSSGADPDWDRVLGVAQTNLHLYGKSDPQPKRKMGHLSGLADSPQEAVALVEEARSKLRG